MWPLIRTSTFQYGLALLVSGIVVLYAASGLRVGTAMHMGPGYFPSLIAWLLIALGAGMVAYSIFRPQVEAHERLGLKHIVLVIGSIILFTFALQPLGVLVAVFGLSVIAAAADAEAKLMEIIVVSLILSAGLALIFVVGLGLPIPLLPQFLR